MIEEPPTLPLYIVTGPNWTAEVPLNEFNAQFDKDTQMLEAATQAIEAFKLIREDINLVKNPESRNEKLQLGTTVLVHLKGSNPEAAANILTHVCMGNIGLYGDAKIMEEEFNKQVVAMRQRQRENEEYNQKIAKESQTLELMKDEAMKKKAPKFKKNLDPKPKGDL